MKNIYIKILAVIAFYFLIPTSNVEAFPLAAPGNFAFQGYLTGLANGNYSIDFTFRKLNGNTAFIAPQVFSLANVQVNAGLFSVIIPGVNETTFLTDPAGGNADIVVDMRVQIDLTPTYANFNGIPITAVPSAFVSHLALNAIAIGGKDVLYPMAPTDGQVLTWNNTTSKWQPTSITIPPAAAGTIGTTELADNSVTTAKIANAAVTGAKIANDAITSNLIAVNSILATDLNTGSVQSDEIDNGTIMNIDISAAAGISDTKLATISTPGKVSNAATSADAAATGGSIVARDGGGGIVGSVIHASTALNLHNPTNYAFYTTLEAPSTLGVAYSLKLPLAQGAVGQMLGIDPVTLGQLTWYSPPALGTVIAPTGNAYLSATIGDAQISAATNILFSTAGFERMRVTNNGLGINSSNPNAGLEIFTKDANSKGLIVKAFAIQTANLQEWQDSGGGIKALVDSSGSIKSNTGLTIGSSGNTYSSIKSFSNSFAPGTVPAQSSIEINLGSTIANANISCNLSNATGPDPALTWSCYSDGSNTIVGRLSCIKNSACSIGALQMKAIVFEP